MIAQIADNSIVVTCRCGHTNTAHRTAGKGTYQYTYCYPRVGVACQCSKFVETRSNMTEAL